MATPQGLFDNGQNGGFGSDQSGGFYSQAAGGDGHPTKKLKMGYSASDKKEFFTLSPIFTDKDNDFSKIDAGSIQDLGMLQEEYFLDQVALYRTNGKVIEDGEGFDTFINWKKKSMSQQQEEKDDGKDIAYIKIKSTLDTRNICERDKKDLFAKLWCEIEEEKPSLRLIDKRACERNGKSQFGCRTNLCVMVEIISGLYVGKKTAISNLLTDYEVLLDNVYWKVHGISRLTDRLWAEINMVQQEITRRRGKDNEIFNILKQDAKMVNLSIAENRVRTIARCVEARLVYTYRRHGEGFEQFQLERAKEQWEGELQCLLDLLEEEEA